VLILLAVVARPGGRRRLRREQGARPSRGSTAQDYEGEGTGEVVVQVEPGDTAGEVADTLVEKDVVASRAAFFDVAAADPRSTGLQPGSYRLRKQMSSAAALELLLDPSARVVGRVTIPEGRNVEQTLQLLAEGSGIPLADYQAAIKDPAALGLPAYAQGNPRASCSRPPTRSSRGAPRRTC
jgi:UPF0755 protein